MSGYNGRRAPNFSQYLNDLNAIPSPYDQAQQQEQEQEVFDVDAELALFTNTEFFDFDSHNVPASLAESRPQADPSSAAQDVKYMDMLNADFNMPNYQYYPSPVVPMQPTTYSAPQPQSSGNNGTTINQAPPQAAPAQAQSTEGQSPASAKRKAEAATLDDSARHAQEEDKRRRNTAASARFRVKKKEREKNLERTVKDVTAKNSALEARVNQLELENRWLKNLITEKNGSSLSDGDLSGMFSKAQESQDGLLQPQRQQTHPENVKLESRSS